MTIEGLGPIQPNQPVNRSERPQQGNHARQGDSVSLSDEARLRAELFQATEQVRASEDVREDRVAEVREKLQDPSYIDKTVLSTVADHLMDVFGL
ncbi:MAG: flagellar biosynthesis anti-sigma factor FlgM [Spirochaetota bacterium]